VPDMYEEWILEAETYAEDVYQLTLDDLGFEFEDCSVIMENPCYWVDQAFKNYDPTPDEEGEPPITWLENASKVRPR